MSTLRAIDLYSGVGGWSLGLRMAGINVVASYDIWSAANETNFKNNHHRAETVDLRHFSLARLPRRIDVVVGSPPCTQFSFSNRGGSGDLQDGLKDLVTFLTIVDHVRPKFWAIENVPRVAKIIEDESGPGGLLSPFSHLNMTTRIINMEDFGLPQRRRRCIAGNLDFELLESYATKLPIRTLGSVLAALNADTVIDPIYGIKVPKSMLSEHIEEASLNEEEERINRANKLMHPVYNSMPFPDPLSRSVRTITATCTRVSRESIVIEDLKNADCLRRLTIRERASLQGFPITYQFYGATYAQKQRMVGNAMPPLFAYYVAQSITQTRLSKLRSLKAGIRCFAPPTSKPRVTAPDTPGSRFPRDRTFRFAIGSLRLKSGVRFELSNNMTDGRPEWTVAFYFGSSKAIKQIALNKSLHVKLARLLPDRGSKDLSKELTALADFVSKADIGHMQSIWSHHGPGATRPFMLLDRLDASGARIKRLLSKKVAEAIILKALETQYGVRSSSTVPGSQKLLRNAQLIAAGLLVGSLTNGVLQFHLDRMRLRQPTTGRKMGAEL